MEFLNAALEGRYRVGRELGEGGMGEVCCRARSWFVALGFCLFSVSASAQAPSHRFAIRDVRVFDGVEVHDRVTVVVADGLIQSVGDDPVPDGFEVIDGSGRTLLPGLIDAHTHYSGPILQRALTFGVTTVLNMGGPSATEMRREQASGQGTDRADLFSADRMARPRSGGFFELLTKIFRSGSGPQGQSVIASLEEADAFVADRVAEGSDYIKILSTAVGDVQSDPAITRAIIEGAHRSGKLAVVHALEQRAAIEAIEAGADGLVHIFGDEEPDLSFATLVADRGAFVVPTLFIYDPAWGVRIGLLQHATEAVRRLKALGVPILAGSDLAFGLVLHRELELLVEAGLTPQEALVAATSATAQSFGFEDRGRVAPGYRADLLLVSGDPTVDILATRDIVQVWKLGVPAPPAAVRVMMPVGTFVFEHPIVTVVVTLAVLVSLIGGGWFWLKRWRLRRLRRRESATAALSPV